MDYYGEPKESTLNIYYTGQIVNGSMCPKSEIREARWFDLQKLPSNFAFDHAQSVLSDWSKMVTSNRGNFLSRHSGIFIRANSNFFHRVFFV